VCRLSCGGEGQMKGKIQQLEQEVEVLRKDNENLKREIEHLKKNRVEVWQTLYLFGDLLDNIYKRLNVPLFELETREITFNEEGEIVISKKK
jgi:hypothetical protein